MADHVFHDEYRDMNAAVVHAKRTSNHLRRDRRSAGPGLDDGLIVRSKLCDLEEELGIRKRTFLETA